jgi:hypothetical protein
MTAFGNPLILSSGLVDCLLGYWMNKVPAAAICIVLTSTLSVILASMMSSDAAVSKGIEAAPDASDGSDYPSNSTLPQSNAAAGTIVSGSFDLRPEVLNLKSSGKYVTGLLVLPEGYSVRDVFIPSVRLNGIVYASTSFSPHNPVVDFVNKETLMLKFDKESVQEILPPGASIPIFVRGSFVDGTCFIASGTVTVIA